MCLANGDADEDLISETKNRHANAAYGRRGQERDTLRLIALHGGSVGQKHSERERED
jgi:hypothetical protein